MQTSVFNFPLGNVSFPVPRKGRAADKLGMSSALPLSKGNSSLNLHGLYKYVAQVEFF